MCEKVISSKRSVQQFSEAALTNYQVNLSLIQHLTLIGVMSQQDCAENTQFATSMWERNKALIETYRSLLSE